VTESTILLRVTTNFRKLVRRVVVLAVAVATPVLIAAPARADVPENWSDPEPVDRLHALLVLGGIPLLLFVVISAAVYVPSLIRGERLTSGGGSHALESHWFGGPRAGKHELESGSETADSGDTGGASGRW
jgi:hypothetical protein